jgi:hypothetical protein
VLDQESLLLVVHVCRQDTKPLAATAGISEWVSAEHEPNRRVKPILVVTRILDATDQRAHPNRDAQLVMGYPPHRINQRLGETNGPPGQVPHPPARIDVAQGEQDPVVIGGDQDLHRQARDTTEDPVELILWQGLCHVPLIGS